MNYEKLYESIYQKGYQNKKNIGIKHVKDLVNVYSFSSILDVGCAQGMAVQAYQNLNINAHGIDVAPTAIKLSKELGIKNCVQASVLDIPFRDGRFDAVVTADVLEHLHEDDVNKAIAEMVRVAHKWIFVRVAKTFEHETSWINIAHDITDDFHDIKNLHLTVKPFYYWTAQFVRTKKVTYEGTRSKKILVFQKK